MMTVLYILLSLLFILAMAALSRMAGGGLYTDVADLWMIKNGYKKTAAFLRRLPEIVFALPFGVLVYFEHGIAWGLAAWAWSFAAMELGHGNGYHDGVYEKDFPDRLQSLDYIVRPLLRGVVWLSVLCGKVTSFPPRSKWYCRVFMTVKGAAIALPLGWVALPFGILWALAYAISFRWTFLPHKDSEAAEWISGAFAAIIIVFLSYGMLAERLGAGESQPIFSWSAA